MTDHQAMGGIMRRVITAAIGLLTVLVLAATGGTGTGAPASAAPAELHRVRQLPACQQEDGQRCVWRNHGPGYSFVAGADRDPGPGESIRRYRVSDRLADRLIARHDSWRHAPAGVRWDLVHPTPSGKTTVTTGRRAIMSVGGTTYMVTRSGLVGTS